MPWIWTDPRGRTTAYGWDIEGTLYSITDPLGKVETYTYNPRACARLTPTPPEDHVVDVHAARPGRVDDRPRRRCDELRVRRRGPPDRDDRRARPPDDGDLRRRRQPAAETDPDGEGTRFVYDDLGDLSREVRPSGTAVDYTRDRTGLVTVVDNHVDAPTHYTYDAMGRVSATWQGDREPQRTRTTVPGDR